MRTVPSCSLNLHISVDTDYISCVYNADDTWKHAYYVLQRRKTYCQMVAEGNITFLHWVRGFLKERVKALPWLFTFFGILPFLLIKTIAFESKLYYLL